MILQVLGSSSRGNGYVLYNSTSALVIEAGVHPKKVKEALDFDISIIDGVLISHSHKDHCKYVNMWIDMGVDVYMSPETAAELGVEGHNLNLVYPKDKIHIGQWEFMPFDLIHDVRCYGYLIRHPETGLFPFITDTYYCQYKFPGLNNIMIECNYDPAILEEKITSGATHPVVRNRVLESHISTEACMKFLDAHDLSKVSNIVLMHLSSSHADPESIKKLIQGHTGVPTHIARSGLSINFNKVL